MSKIIEALSKFIDNPQGVLSLFQYLKFFGYVATAENDDDISIDEVLKAVKNFQEQFGINESGIGPKTLKAMEWPRCGVKEAFLKEALSSPKWGKNTLSYYVAKRDSDLSPSVWDSCIAKAFGSWSEVTPLKFIQVDRQDDGDFVLSVGVTKADDFDGPSGVLAWCQLPPKANFNGQLLAKFDAGETWVADASRRGIILENVACHEFGHGLGLEHSSKSSALMAPFYSPNVRKPQPVDDIPRIQGLYGKPLSKPAPTPTPTPVPTPVPTPTNGSVLIQIEGNISNISIPGYRVTKMG